jgi:hypothetical protein
MATIDFAKLPSNSTTAAFMGPGGGATLGVTDTQLPLSAELNNTGGTSGMVNATPAISWNDFDFGIQESETTNEPSLADSANYEEYGIANYGGGMSTYYPEAYDDPSNILNVVYDMTDQLGDIVDIALRVDGDLKWDVPAADGQFVSVYRAEVNSEANPFEFGSSKRRTVDFAALGDFSYMTVLGSHTMTLIPPATTPWAVGRKGRLRVSMQGRDVTNMDTLSFSVSDPTVIELGDDGSYHVIGDAADTATITVVETGTANTATQSVTVTA